ncbi:MAG: autotransporter-associated beta strand repeat-containing protein [Verrucomicrobia bacterium]|nr:autotransporter-associated beta strand repeat-containing protein [Verrucomicrobiota bacterium]
MKTLSDCIPRTENSFVSPLLSRSLPFAAFLALVLLFGGEAQAANGTWSVGGNASTSGTWDSSATNWTGVSGSPWDSSNGTTNIALFGVATGAFNVTLSGSVYANGITLTTSGTTNAPNITGVGSLNFVGTNATINVGTGTRLLVTSTGGVSGDIIKTGAGEIFFQNTFSNTVAGNMTINTGAVIIRNTTYSAASSKTITVNTNTSGAGLVLYGATPTFTNIGVTLNGGRVDNGSGNSILNAAVTLNNTGTNYISVGRYSATTGTFTVNGTISGAGGFTVQGQLSDGAGTVRLVNTSNSYQGDTTIETGTLQLGASNVIPDGANAGNVIMNGGATLAGSLDLNAFNETINGLSGTSSTVNAQIYNSVNSTASTLTVGANDATATFAGAIKNNLTGSGTMALTKTGNGTQTLSGNNSYSGATTINGGVLQAGAAAGGQAFGSNSAVTLANTAGVALALNNFSQTIGSLAGGGTTGGNVTLGSGTLTTGGNNASSAFAGSISGSGGLTKVGTGRQDLSGNLSYTGQTTVNNGGLGFNGVTNTAAGDIVINSSGAAIFFNAINTWNATSAKTITVNANASNAGLVLYNGNGPSFTNISVILNGGRIDSASGSGTLFAPVTLNNTGTNYLSTGFGLGAGGSGALIMNAVISGSGGFTAQAAAAGGVKLANSGNSYQGDTTIESGYLQLGASNVIPDGANTGNVIMNGGTTLAGKLDMNGFNETINGLSGTSNATSSQIYNNGSGTVTLTLGANNATSSFAGIIKNNTGAGGLVALTKTGTGTQTLSGSNTYTGATTVTLGTLLINGSTASGSAFNVTGGTVGGNGTIGGALTIASGATLAPGNSPGILSTGNLSITGNLSMELNGATVGTQYDQVNVAGTVNLVTGNALALTLGYTPTNGTNFFLINNDGSDAIIGTLNGYAQGATFTVSSQQFQISYTGDSGTNSFSGSGNDLVIQAVPEPATWALLAFSLTTVMVLRRRRRN